LQAELEPGEHIVADMAATSDPSLWYLALLPVALAMVAAGLADLFGSQPVPRADRALSALAALILGLAIQFAGRPVYVAVTDRRLVCRRMSRVRRGPEHAIFEVSLADLRVASYRFGKYQSFIRCQGPGHQRIRLAVSRAGRGDFANFNVMLARSGAFASLDPPYPAVGRH
jgi:hypothetical protein